MLKTPPFFLYLSFLYCILGTLVHLNKNNFACALMTRLMQFLKNDTKTFYPNLEEKKGICSMEGWGALIQHCCLPINQYESPVEPHIYWVMRDSCGPTMSSLY